MRFLYNATTNAKGGSAQRAASFVVEASRDPRGHDWLMALTPAQADVARHCPPPIQVQIFEDRPSQSRQARRALLQLERDFGPDCVYTQLGPAYVRFRTRHLMGVADAWVTHPSLCAFRTLPFPGAWITMAAACAYKAWWLSRADAWVIETEYARQAFHRLHRQPLAKIAVVLNTCGRHYREASPTIGTSPTTPRPFRILTFAAPYPHKRLEIIPLVARELSRLQPDLDFRWRVTLPPECPEWRQMQVVADQYGVAERLENFGVIPIQQGPEIYRDCDVCFLPTILETFSVSYPEAMAMNVPMITTDLPFARDICQNAALYFPPDNHFVAAEQLIQVLLNTQIRQQLIQAGHAVLETLPTAEKQYAMQVELMEALVQGQFPLADHLPNRRTSA